MSYTVDVVHHYLTGALIEMQAIYEHLLTHWEEIVPYINILCYVLLILTITLSVAITQLARRNEGSSTAPVGRTALTKPPLTSWVPAMILTCTHRVGILLLLCRFTTWAVPNPWNRLELWLNADYRDYCVWAQHPDLVNPSPIPVMEVCEAWEVAGDDWLYSEILPCTSGIEIDLVCEGWSGKSYMRPTRNHDYTLDDLGDFEPPEDCDYWLRDVIEPQESYTLWVVCILSTALTYLSVLHYSPLRAPVPSADPYGPVDPNPLLDLCLQGYRLHTSVLDYAYCALYRPTQMVFDPKYASGEIRHNNTLYGTYETDVDGHYLISTLGGQTMRAASIIYSADHIDFSFLGIPVRLSQTSRRINGYTRVVTTNFSVSPWRARRAPYHPFLVSQDEYGKTHGYTWRAVNETRGDTRTETTYFSRIGQNNVHPLPVPRGLIYAINTLCDRHGKVPQVTLISAVSKYTKPTDNAPKLFELGQFLLNHDIRQTRNPDIQFIVEPNRDPSYAYNAAMGQHGPIAPIKVRGTWFCEPIMGNQRIPVECLDNEGSCYDGRVRMVHKDIPNMPSWVPAFLGRFCACLRDSFFLLPGDYLQACSLEEVYEDLKKPVQRSKFLQYMSIYWTADMTQIWVDAFQKVESYADFKVMRNISGVDFKHVIELARYIIPLTRAMKELPWYGFGSDHATTGAKVFDLMNSGATTFIETDYSKFDGTQSANTHSIECEIMKLLYHPSTHSELDELYTKMLTPTAKTKGGLIYPTHGTRLSGHANTSSGNTLLNAFVSFSAVNFNNLASDDPIWDNLGIFAGDDGLTMDVDPDIFNMLATSLGFSATVESKNVGDPLSFLSRQYPVPTISSGHLPDIRRSIGKLHISVHTDITEKQHLINKCAGYRATDMDSHYHAALVRMCERLYPGEIDKVPPEDMNYHARKHHENMYHNHFTADENMAFAATQIGVDEAAIMEFIEATKTATVLADLPRADPEEILPPPDYVVDADSPAVSILQLNQNANNNLCLPSQLPTVADNAPNRVNARTARDLLQLRSTPQLHAFDPALTGRVISQ